MIQRYDSTPDGLFAYLDGKYVRYEDHQAEVEKLEKRLSVAVDGLKFIAYDPKAESDFKTIADEYIEKIERAG